MKENGAYKVPLSLMSVGKFKVLTTFQENTRWQILNIFLGIATILWISLLIGSEKHAFDLVDEDGVIEWLQVAFFLISAIILFWVGFIQVSRQWMIGVGFCMLGLGLLFLCGEELSWGERLFQSNYFEAIRQYNAQNETNFHNLYPIQRYRHWLIFFFGIVGLLYGLTGKSPAFLGNTVQIFQPSKHLSFLFAVIMLFGIAPEIGFLIRKLSSLPAESYQIHLKFARSTEIGELYISIATLIYAICKFQTHRVSR